MRRPHKVQINYKSGQSVVIRCVNFEVKFNLANEVTSVTWECAKPSPLTIGVDSIESVWELS